MMINQPWEREEFHNSLLDEALKSTKNNNQAMMKAVPSLVQENANAVNIKPESVEPKKSFGQKIGGFFTNLRNDPARMANLAVALNSMRLQPDAGLAQAMSLQASDARKQKLLDQTGNRTADTLIRLGVSPDIVNSARGNPETLNTLLTSTLTSRQTTTKMKDAEAVLDDWSRRDNTKYTNANYNDWPDELKRAYARVGGYEVSTDTMSGADYRSTLKDFVTYVEDDPTYKTFDEQTIGMNKVYELANIDTQAADIALVFYFMKALDPRSVVRESEFKTAKEAAAAITRSQQDGSLSNITLMETLKNQLLGKGFLPEETKQAMMELSESAYSSAYDALQRRSEKVKEYGTAIQVKPEHVDRWATPAPTTSELSPYNAEQALNDWSVSKTAEDSGVKEWAKNNWGRLSVRARNLILKNPKFEAEEKQSDGSIVKKRMPIIEYMLSLDNDGIWDEKDIVRWNGLATDYYRKLRGGSSTNKGGESK
jgi:hypothetical protein